MIRVFQMGLERLQPSQLYISAEKLRAVRTGTDQPEPIPIRQLGAHLIMTDGHTRAFAAWSSGLDEVPVVWDMDELDWDAYRICVQWCVQEGIHTIAGLQDRVIDAQAYQALWLDRCAAMHRDLAAGRSTGIGGEA